ncbi:MAG: 50S ribosomal protein L18 [Candidatus Saccharimonadales bacterium]
MAKRRTSRVRSVVSGSTARPRLAVFISHQHVTAQIIDDSRGATLAYVTTAGRDVSGTLSDKVAWVGTQIAAKAKKVKIHKVVFDRGNRRYHGRLKTLADASRAGGLEF